jgi:hypothetical protein
VAKIKDFLLQLENDQQLLDTYRATKAKQARKKIATDNGLTDKQAEVLQSTNLKQIRRAIENESPGETFFCVVMAD